MALFRLPPALVARTDRITLTDPVFISDLHLNAAQPATRAAFARFCSEIAPAHRELVILGDLFEFWAGDDDPDAVGAEVAQRLAQLATSGTAVYLMHGNRDLLLGSRFCERAQATLLADPTLAMIDGHGVLLSHGDAYCTLDTEYMAFRRKARKPLFQTVFLAKSLEERRRMIGQARATSEATKAVKPMQIMDVTPTEITQAMAHYSVRTMVHGHTHRPATHHEVVDGQAATRWVLPDWDLDSPHKRGGYLTVRQGNWRVHALDSEFGIQESGNSASPRRP